MVVHHGYGFSDPPKIIALIRGGNQFLGNVSIASQKWKKMLFVCTTADAETLKSLAYATELVSLYG